MLGSRQQRSDTFAKQAFPTNGNGIERCTVKTVPHRDSFVPAGCITRQLEGHPNSRGTTRREQHFIESAGGELGTPAREVYRNLIGIAPRTERELVKLRSHRINNALVTVLDLMYNIAMEIHYLATLNILYEDTITFRDHI